MSNSDLFDTRPKVLHKLPENPEGGPGHFPSWLHRTIPKKSVSQETHTILNKSRLSTVCEEAKCPNLPECWSKKTATFLIMGHECTRACGFCDIDFAKNPKPLEIDEPDRLAQSVGELGLKHVVITQVARDDLPDGGAAHLSLVMKAIRDAHPETTIEVLTSDYHGNHNSWDTILDAEPEIFNHNIETVRRLTPKVRHKATYERTLNLLSHVKQQRKKTKMLVKSGLMVGLGETTSEVEETIKDLKEAGCDIITIGQYLQASPKKLRVKAFIPPETFDHYTDYGRNLGVKQMYCGPFVRSSYNAKELLDEARL